VATWHHAPLEQARDIDLGDYADWLDSERIVGTSTGRTPPPDALPRADVIAALQEMITHNDGRLLLCYT
jgi:cyclase